MSAFVFLGPSLPLARARAVLDATYLPPVAMGDLYALARWGAKPGDVVGIVDGLFEQVPAVWHKEVLFALSRGVRVFGAASMGALRAAELDSFGMIGVGRIYEAYRSGDLEEDADVVVIHGPAETGYRPLSEAMVNVRWALARAASESIISEHTRELLTRRGEAQPYAERSWTSVLAVEPPDDVPLAEIERLRAFLGETRPDAKGMDALALLERMADELTRPAARATPDFVLEETAYWVGLTQLKESQHRPNAGSEATMATSNVVLEHLRATDPAWATRRDTGLLLRLVADLAGALPMSSADRQETLKGFCRQFGLTSNEALEGWLIQQQLNREELSYLLALWARRDLLLRSRGRDVDALIVLDMKGRGEFAELADRVAMIWTQLREVGIEKPTLQDAGIDADGLQRWYEARRGAIGESPEHHAAGLGFESLRDFVTQLLALYMFDHPLPQEANVSRA